MGGVCVCVRVGGWGGGGEREGEWRRSRGGRGKKKREKKKRGGHDESARSERAQGLAVVCFRVGGLGARFKIEKKKMERNRPLVRALRGLLRHLQRIHCVEDIELDSRQQRASAAEGQ